MGCACEAVHHFPCQFPDETEFHAFDGQQWCLFHLPLENAKGRKSPKDSWGRREPDWRRFEDAVFERLRNPRDENPNPFIRHQVSDLRAVVFPHSFDFSPLKDTTLYPDFTDAIFGEHAWFADATFGVGARFAGATFGEDAGFVGTTFGDRASFADATFWDLASFMGATFEDRASFADATFGDLASFTDATFGDRASFAGAAFGDDAEFSGATFGDSAGFKGATFGDRAGFKGATFGDRAGFMGATFGDEAGFAGATFGDCARFADATFGEAAHFTDAVFIGSAFLGTLSETPEKRRFSYVSFNGAEFRGSCSFENREFSTTASFAHATFRDVVEFHGCKFHQGISFFRTKFLATRGTDDEETEELERAYRTLKLAMEELRARNEEARFFALEMECHRQQEDVPRLERAFASLYKLTSNYGRSINRPVVCLAVSLVVFVAIYWIIGCLTNPSLDQEQGQFPYDLAVLTFEQLVKPFSVWTRSSSSAQLPLVENNPLLLPILASLQSLFNLSLLAVFLLALRRRFKMD